MKGNAKIYLANGYHILISIPVHTTDIQTGIVLIIKFWLQTKWILLNHMSSICLSCLSNQLLKFLKVKFISGKISFSWRCHRRGK